MVIQETPALKADCELSPNKQLLASLPPGIADVLQSRTDAVDLAAGTMLCETGTVLRHVHFPVTAVVTLVSSLQDGACAEVAPRAAIRGVLPRRRFHRARTALA
jgi:hypothetical protein